ncbi:MAG: tyrosine recombinase XerD [Bacteroidales bacterium]|nr:tyrosine recombinase XerD [Bacteroidales bacterium]
MNKNAWETAIRDFRSYLTLERSLSPRTVESYISDIGKLRLSVGDSFAPETVTGQTLADFLSGDYCTALKKRSLARMVSSLKSFFGFLETDRRISQNPCDRIDAPKPGLYLPEVLSLEEVERVLEGIDLSSVEGRRSRAMLEVLYGCGLRVSELVGLRVQDVFFDEGFVRVVGKGDKQRLVPIGVPAMEALRFYLEDRCHIQGSGRTDVVFLSRRGTGMTRQMAFLLVKKHAEAAGITKTISPHTFRHSFATHLVENGADLRVVQQMLGHESILTTEIYTHINSRLLQENILKYHPRG